MEIKAIVKYKGHFAEYKITEEPVGIYNAVLVHFEGTIHELPSPYITLTKGVRHWIGSTFDQPLIDSLGEIVEVNLHSHTSFPEQEDENKVDKLT